MRISSLDIAPRALFVLLLMGLGACQMQTTDEKASAVGLNIQDWRNFCDRFVTNDGRVIDEAQQRVTHSEAQAYAMLLATAYDDRKMFDRLWSWTRAHLQVRANDHLLAWLWREEEQRVLDFNNATDADLVVIWSLWRASRLWKDSEYEQEAQRMASSLSALLRSTLYGPVLRPGAEGFPVREGLILNPSYWVFPVFRDLRGQVRGVDWRALDDSAMKWLRHSGLGSWRLSPDWVHIWPDGRIQAWEDRPARFSYDAIRVPLFLAWVGREQALSPYLRFWRMFSMREWFPDQVDLSHDLVHMRKDFAVPAAMFSLLQHVVGENASFPSVRWYAGINAYEAALQMFCQMAWLDVDAQRRKGDGGGS